MANDTLTRMPIERYSAQYRDTFVSMMTACFTEDYALDLTVADVRHKVSPHFLELDAREISPILLAFRDGAPVGFAIYQIDSPRSDWCERVGWGFVRECYVVPEARRVGVATQLIRAVERRLTESGATDAYLTADDAVEFWEALGWQRTDVVAKNEGIVLEKRLHSLGAS